MITQEKLKNMQKPWRRNGCNYCKIEEELADLGKEEAEEYLKELGIEDSGINRMIKSVYNLLKLRTFITAGEKEVRAWTITAGTKAPQAAGVIHTDLKRIH